MLLKPHALCKLELLSQGAPSLCVVAVAAVGQIGQRGGDKGALLPCAVWDDEVWVAQRQVGALVKDDVQVDGSGAVAGPALLPAEARLWAWCVMVGATHAPTSTALSSRRRSSGCRGVVTTAAALRKRGWAVT